MTVLVGLLPATPALAQAVSTSAATRVLGDVTHQRLEIGLSSGAVARGDVVRFREDDPNIELRPRLARGVVAGLERMVPMAQNRLARGAIVGINGGYSLPRPTGVPNGLHVTDGRMVAGQAVNSFGGGGRPTGRGMLGIQPGGRMVMDELAVTLELDQPDATAGPKRIDEVNRQVWPSSATKKNGESWRPEGELLLYDDRFGAPVSVPGGSLVVVVRGLTVGTSGRTEGDIVAIYDPEVDSPYRLSPDRHALVAYGERRGDLEGAVKGHRIGVTTTLTPLRTAAEGWRDLTGGVAGGQLLVQNGAIRPSTEWSSYAAFGESHAFGRQPRTAIGRTASGEGLLVTVDGRQSNWSAGLTALELANTMIALGAVDVVNLDGGGSTTMTIEAQVRNRPSESGRYIADALFLHAPLPPPTRPLVNACPDGAVPGTDFADVPGTTHAATIDCLAWWKVTSGVTPTQYSPAAGVTREQMASFVARWVDGVSDRGDGPTLPSAGATPFRDVADGNVHRDAISRLTQAGIIRGTSDTTYSPRKVMTRAQTASLMRQAVDFVNATPIPASRDTFLDDNTSVHEANIDRLAGVGVISGTGGFTFNPSGTVTRGAMSALIMRSSDLLVEQGRTAPPA